MRVIVFILLYIIEISITGIIEKGIKQSPVNWTQTIVQWKHKQSGSKSYIVGRKENYGWITYFIRIRMVSMAVY